MAKSRTEHAPPARKCRTCEARVARNAKHDQCRRCYDRDRADLAAGREHERIMKRQWKTFLKGWSKLGVAITEAANAEKLLLKYGRLARESGGKWRLTDLDLNRHNAPCVRFRRGAVIFLATVRKIAVVRSRGVCELLDPKQVSAA